MFSASARSCLSGLAFRVERGISRTVMRSADIGPNRAAGRVLVASFSAWNCVERVRLAQRMWLTVSTPPTRMLLPLVL